MRNFLRFLVLIAASAIPALSWAATSYGIYMDGTMINSDNCQNVKTTHLISGSVKYDYSSNTLTLDNVYFNVNNESYFLNVTSSVKNGLKIVVKGYNYIGDCNGITIAIHKPTNASASSPSVYFQGDGVLALYKGEIETFDGVSLSFGKSSVSDTDGGLDIYTRYIMSRNSAGGYVWISDANLHLTTGTTYGNGTFGGFTNVFMYNGIAAYSADGQNKYSYGGASVLRDQNGNMVTGPAYIGYEKYGLNLFGKEVTKGNYNRLNLADTYLCKGTFSYVPSTNTLNMTNAEIYDNAGSDKLDHYNINNSIDGLKVNVTGTCKISENIGSTAVYSTGNITFQGTGTLTIRSSAGKAIDMAATGKTLAFNNLTASVQYGGINCNSGTLYLSKCTLDVAAGGVYYGGIKNMKNLTCSYAAITTSGVYYDDRQNNFYKVGSSSAYTGALSFKPVNNYYGIMVCGVELTEHNYNSVAAPYIERGSITYDPSANELTLNNLTIDTKERGAFAALAIHSKAKSGMKIKLVGHNVIKKTNGAAVLFQEPSDATSYSNPHYYIDGTGSLVLEECGILCFDYCNLCFGSGLQGGQGLGGCTIDAQYLQARSAGQGRIWFTDCMMTLRGYGSGATFMNFANVFTSSNCIVRTPENGSYNSSSYYMADANGNKVTGEIYIGWKKYGLKVLGVEVNEIIKDHIQDLINPTPCIQNINSSGSHPAYNCFKYDPSTKTLYMKNVYINDSYNKADLNALCIENTGDELHIKCEGTNRISMNRGNTATIYSTKSLEFRGSGSLEVYASTRNAIEIAGDDQYVKFYYCNTEVNGSSTYGQAICTNNGDKFRLYVEKANVTVKGSVHGISYYSLTNAAISTPQVFVQPANDQYPTGCFRRFGQGEYVGETVFKPITTNYGIRVGGHPLNDVNCNNFYFDDITSGNVSYDVSSNTLTLNNVTANCTQKRYSDGKVTDWNSNGMNITSSATSGLYINLIGNNVFNNIDGVGIDINKNTMFKGDGSIDIGNKTIACFENSNITFAENCTVNAQRMYGSENNGGNAYVTNNATLNLTGGVKGYPTVYGFAAFYTDGISTNKISTQVVTPNGGWYDQDEKKFITHIIDGEQTVYGPVKIAPVTYYGVSIQAINVNSANCDDIFRDLPHEGTMSYSPQSHTLYMEDFKVAGSRRTGGIDENWQGKDFCINLTGENEVTGFGYLVFQDDTYFYGGGSLKAENSVVYSRNSLSFSDCTFTDAYWIEHNDSSYANLNLQEANLSLTGNYTGQSTIQGFNNLLLLNAQIVYPESWAYSDGQLLHNNATYSGEVDIVAVKSYGINVAGTEVTSLNQDDILGDGTMSLTVDEDGIYTIEMKNTNLQSGITISEDCYAEGVAFLLEGSSSITIGRGDCIYAGRPIVFTSDDGKGKLTLNGGTYGTGIYSNNEYGVYIIDCEVNICAGMYGIQGSSWNSPVAGVAGEMTYVGVLEGDHETRLTIDTQTNNGNENLKDIGIYLDGDYEIVQPDDASYDVLNSQITDVTGAPLSNTVLEVVVKPSKITLEDITNLIEMYLEPYSNITVEDITNLIDRYLEQE
ncbi:MAG: hypothetical protein IJT97_06215 [Bacteroidaceae bacterium]|nr:hypothetical protein [Bacteroidaceae bacterium]